MVGKAQSLPTHGRAAAGTGYFCSAAVKALSRKHGLDLWESLGTQESGVPLKSILEAELYRVGVHPRQRKNVNVL